MTDARDRLAQGLEILMARPYNYWHLKEAADAIAAFVEERIGERDVAILDQTGRDLGVRVDALTQRLEAVEALTRSLEESRKRLEPVQPAPAACEWWLVLAGDGDVLEVFAFEDEARRWATEQDATTADGPPHCVVRVVSAGSEPVAEREVKEQG